MEPGTERTRLVIRTSSRCRNSRTHGRSSVCSSRSGRPAHPPRGIDVIYIVTRLTFVPGRASDASKYEHAVLAYFVEHGGEIIAAFKPQAQADGLPLADEVQILRIPKQEQLDAYL